jgi:hypothetical protein
MGRQSMALRPVGGWHNSIPQRHGIPRRHGYPAAEVVGSTGRREDPPAVPRLRPPARLRIHRVPTACPPRAYRVPTACLPRTHGGALVAGSGRLDGRTAVGPAADACGRAHRRRGVPPVVEAHLPRACLGGGWAHAAHARAHALSHTRTHEHTHTHTRTHAHARTHARGARTHALSHTRTHTCTCTHARRRARTAGC